MSNSKTLSRIVVLVAVVACIAIFFVVRSKNSTSQPVVEDLVLGDEIVKEPEPRDHVVQLPIVEGSTFGKLMADADIDPNLAQEIFLAAEDVYDVSKIRIGRTLDLYYDKETQDFWKVVYQIDSEELLVISKVAADALAVEAVTESETDMVFDIPASNESASDIAEAVEWIAQREVIEYEVRTRAAGGTIETSMYQAALDAGIDERAIIELANAFQWSVDFALDVRTGDTFSFVYEERYLDGEYVMPGRIFAGKFVNRGTENYVYYFEEHEDNIGFFDQDGNSVQKMFLKAPVAFKYISSGFTTGLRYVAAFNVSTGHRAIDYAASAGTPVRSVGDGTVTLAGWDGPYGNKVSIRHNGTYSTNYAHLSGFAVRNGQRVSQGQTIGYVGSTGFSTGPHLHYEMVKNGVKINPLLEVLPPGEPIADENKERFFAEVETYKAQLDEY